MVERTSGITLKKTTWGEISQLIKDGKMHGWNQLQSQAFTYQYFLHMGILKRQKIRAVNQAWILKM